MEKHNMQIFMENAKPFNIKKMWAFYGLIILLSSSLIIRIAIQNHFTFLFIYISIMLLGMLYVMIDVIKSKRNFINVQIGGSLLTLILLFVWDVGMYYYGLESDPNRVMDIILIALSQVIVTILLLYYMRFIIAHNNRNDFRAYKIKSVIILSVIVYAIGIAPIISNEKTGYYFLIYSLYSGLAGALLYAMAHSLTQALVYKKITNYRYHK